MRRGVLRLSGDGKAGSRQRVESGRRARELATERHYPLVDIYERFEAEGDLKTARAKGDMHPSEYGVRLIAEGQFEVLQQVLKERR